ncbi:MAG: AzlC family ABC transporter permease [Veillonellaceae bacterium]|nr:AzlC family ABC transporter permease [Veillonellaceae bacterium]MDD6923863.1 AzlC family ABC transporter permease [Veillonellaceae bacterium]
MHDNHRILKAFRAAFPLTVPIFAGFCFLGMAYGIYMNAAGFSPWYPFFMSMLIFGGSLEFIAVSMLLAPFAPLQAFIVALMVQARHIFYGLSMLEKFRGTGWKKPYLIFGMCDETFSINFTAKVPEGVDRGWMMFFVTLLNQLYWVSGATIGAIAGSMLSFDTHGVEFVMTAMFTAIFMEQWMKERLHYTAIIGIVATAVSLAVFGADSFLIPAMAAIVIILTILRGPLERRGIT